nr:MAG TPA: hypothetical protein [Caudoviricetes sp.]
MEYAITRGKFLIDISREKFFARGVIAKVGIFQLCLEKVVRVSRFIS